MNKGSSQETRKNIALRADYISIDERSMLDLVQFTRDYSQNINFYGLQNTVIHKWKSFLKNDPAFILSMIATVDIQKLQLNNDDLAARSNPSDEFEICLLYTSDAADEEDSVD